MCIRDRRKGASGKAKMSSISGEGGVPARRGRRRAGPAGAMERQGAPTSAAADAASARTPQRPGR
eukprot:8378549-Alexandrium_andersonii.AAC.1